MKHKKIFIGDSDIESYNVCMNFFPKKIRSPEFLCLSEIEGFDETW